MLPGTGDLLVWLGSNGCTRALMLGFVAALLPGGGREPSGGMGMVGSRALDDRVRLSHTSLVSVSDGRDFPNWVNRDGLRCPRFFRFSPESRHSSQGSACLKGATFGSRRAHSIISSERTNEMGRLPIDTDRAAFWCATPHRMVNETEELDRCVARSIAIISGSNYLITPSLGSGIADQSVSVPALTSFRLLATALSGSSSESPAGRLSPACPIAPDPDACGR